MTGTALAKTPVHAGGAVAAIVPQSLDEAYRLAAALASSGLAPKGFERPEQIMVAVMAGAELGLAPYQAMQSFAVINGRATMWGDALVAVVRANGCRIKETFQNEGPTLPDAMTAVCEVTRPDGEVIEATFSVADAKRANLWGKAGPWQQYPKRMLKSRARAFALRDGCADMLRGVQVREEVEDYGATSTDLPVAARGHVAVGSGMRERLEARSGVGGFDADHVGAQIDAAQADDIPAEFDELPAEATLDADPEPHFDPPADDGLPVRDDSAEDDFPGDRTATEQAADLTRPIDRQELTLAARVAAFKKRIDEATTTTKLTAVGNNASAKTLRADLERSDPEEGVALADYIAARWDALERAEKGGK
jgi:hypothetical protein